MPTRPYSAAIIGGLWPSTSPDAWSDVGDDLAKKADSLDAGASDYISKPVDSDQLLSLLRIWAHR